MLNRSSWVVGLGLMMAWMVASAAAGAQAAPAFYVDATRGDDTQDGLKPETACRWYNLSIRDNGCGMSSNVQRRIFDPFFTTKPKDMGSGLGLFTTHGNIQRHGGTISVESVQGEGTEFVLAFPLMEEGISEKDSQEAEAPAYSP